MNEQQVRRLIEEILSERFGGDGADMIVSKLLKMEDGRNIQVGRTTGTKIGTAIDQKLGFFGATPVDKPETLADPAADLTALQVAVSGLIDRLQELGLMK